MAKYCAMIVPSKQAKQTSLNNRKQFKNNFKNTLTFYKKIGILLPMNNKSSMVNHMKTQIHGFKDENVKLRFSKGNAKLDGIFSMSLPAGHSCPFAKDCLSKTVQKPSACGYELQDGKNTKFRCFAALDESRYPNVRISRWHNFLTILEQKTVESLANLIQRSIPQNKWGAPIRIHVSGDFFSQMYFDAWLMVAENNPSQTFYAYTKALPLWVNRLDSIPSNFVLTASKGGTHDALIEKHNLRSAIVVLSEEEADKLGLEIDHDDSHAYSKDGGDFALLIHGTQPAGTDAAKAWYKVKYSVGGYTSDKKRGSTPPLPMALAA